MAGYIRTSVGVEDNIADGLTINAADFNSEYDAIEVAFGTSGHTHDGTAGNGPAITAVGPSLAYEFNANAMQPKSGQTSLDLGTTGLRFDNTFFTTTNTNNLTVNTSTTLTGTVNIGSVSLEEYIEDITGGNLTAGTGIAVAYDDNAGTGTVSLSHLGLQSLTDPNADRIAFWDDSGGSFNWLGLGGGLSISGTNLVVSDATTSASGFMSAADKTTLIGHNNKLNGIEANAKDDQTITAGAGLTGGGTGDVTISHADTSSAASLASGSARQYIKGLTLDTYGHVTAWSIGTEEDQTAAQIRAKVEAANDSNVFTDADHTKLNAIEAGATGDQTNAEIRAAVEAATNSNVFTDADHTKLNGIETNATADQTGAQIKTAYEGESNTNAFTDAEKTKLASIDANAQTVTTTNVTAAGAVMDSELASEASVKAINQQLTTTSSPSFTAVSTDTINEKTSANGVSIDGVTLKDGDVVLNSSKSLDFSANSDTTSETGTNVHTEKFSKFEQGTFTPYLYGDTESGDIANAYQWQDGFYQRVGDFVHLHIMIRILSKDSSASSGNQIEIKGLPFSHYSTGQTMPLVMMPVIGANLGTGFTGMNIKGTIANGSSIPGILLWYNTTSAPTTWSRLRLSMLANGCLLNLQTTHLLGTIN